MSRFVKQVDVEQEQFDWGTIGWRARPANTGSKQLVVMDVTLEPGEGHAFHRHDGQEDSDARLLSPDSGPLDNE